MASQLKVQNVLLDIFLPKWGFCKNMTRMLCYPSLFHYLIVKQYLLADIKSVVRNMNGLAAKVALCQQLYLFSRQKEIEVMGSAFFCQLKK